MCLTEVPDSRFSASIYDPFLWLGERLGMARRRQSLVAESQGRTLEIGAGTGLNLRHYPDHLEELVLAEPAAAMAKRIDVAAAPPGVPTSVVEARGEHLPFADDSFDTVVSTLVLCTVEDPELTLSEVARVLRPGGRLLFCEHVEADSPRLRRWQHRLAGPWASFADGCRCDRATLKTIAARLRLGEVERPSWRGMPPLVRPLVVGEATV